MACQVSPVDVVDKPRSRCPEGVKIRFFYVVTLKDLSRKWEVFLIPVIETFPSFAARYRARSSDAATFPRAAIVRKVRQELI